MKFCLLPLTLLAVFGLAVAAETNYPSTPRAGRPTPGRHHHQEFTRRRCDEENKDVRRERNYPEQPPTIPHSIRGYHVDKNANKCLSCHSRANSARAQAPMISITHYTDRDQQTLAAVAPRRYFCTQCHVPQQDVKPLVENRFKNIDELLYRETSPSTGGN